MIEELLKGIITQKEALIETNANITYISLPKYVYGFVFNYKGINNIIINFNLSCGKQKHTIIHELAHIELNHLEQCDKDLFAFHIKGYEDEANRYIKFISEI